jgi:alpha-N-arabinofuranosidase
LWLARAGARAGVSSGGQVQDPSQASIIPNPSFETVDADRPASWRRAIWQKTADLHVDDTVAHSGARSARISSKDGGDASWSVTVIVKPFARYRLSGWIKVQDLEPGAGRGALLNLHGLQGMETAAVTGTRDWTEVQIEFDTGANDSVQINCLFGGWGRARGTAWYDDIALELLSARALAPSVIVDTARTRPAMSKYIYGQFIEHLGRCIYGGLWAEMVEDRKFFHAVGAKESPWTALGDPQGVSMNKVAPFVGAQTPEIRWLGNGTPAGLAQDALALIKGRHYVGRIVLSGDASAAPVRVSLVWGPAPADRKSVTIARLGAAFTTTPLAFTASASNESGRIEITSSGRGAFRVGAVSLMPADNIEGFRADVIALLRELDAPVYRWPGGNFVSGYDWKDGIGDRDRRPTRKNPAWQGIEPNDVGIHEYMALCRLIGAEPYIAVNSGLGDVTAAADEVEYVNGAPSTPMGALRTKNGHRQPFGCKWWSVGNEMYGDWQLGHMPLADYVKKHGQFAAAMRQVDPTIQLIAVGSTGAWDEAMLAGNADNMSLISEHFYCQERPGLMSHVAQVPAQIRRIAEAHRGYRRTIPALADKNIRVALDEWNYWYGPHVYGELGTRYFLKDALGIAAGIHEYSRQSDIIFIANYAQTVNVIGAIKTTKTAAAFETTGLVLKLYRAKFGQLPVEVAGAPQPLDVAAAWREDRSALTVSVVNPTRSEQTLQVALPDLSMPATARLWRISGTDERAYNEPGKPPVVAIQETAAAPFGASLSIPPMSISLFELKLK